MESETIQIACVENSSEKVGCKCKQRIMGLLKGREEDKISERKYLRKLRIGNPLASLFHLHIMNTYLDFESTNTNEN